VSHDDIERLYRLQDAYGIQRTADLGEVANAIIEGTEYTLPTEYGSVMAVLSLVVGDEGTFEALRSGNEISSEVRDRMVRAVQREEPTTPAETIVGDVLEAVRAAFSPPD
jgi:hypothetical protein